MRSFSLKVLFLWLVWCIRDLEWILRVLRRVERLILIVVYNYDRLRIAHNWLGLLLNHRLVARALINPQKLIREPLWYLKLSFSSLIPIN